jgi:pimeloyl-ACP methyl ester carboxylesterase
MPPDQYFQVEGARLRYRDEGSGPPIVLVHGWTLDLNLWDFQVERLQTDFRLIRYDRRGFGLSSGVPDLLQDTRDLLSLCGYLRAQPVGLVGMSQGARVVLAVARLKPRWTGRVVFDGPPDLISGAAPASDDLEYAELRRVAKDEGLEAFRRTWRNHALTTLETADAAAHQLLGEVIGRYPGLDLISTDTSGPRQPFETPSQRALVLNGAMDTPARLHAGAALAAALPECERAVVPLARHFPNLDNPTSYSSHLLRFFSPTADAWEA